MYDFDLGDIVLAAAARPLFDYAAEAEARRRLETVHPDWDLTEDEDGNLVVSRRPLDDEPR